jgi:hypothetical protein
MEVLRKLETKTERGLEHCLRRVMLPNKKKTDQKSLFFLSSSQW